MRDGRRQGVLESIDRLFRAGTAAGLSDGQLLERFASRHDEAAEGAFAALVERHGPMVLRVCRRLLDDPNDAHDAFQSTFLVLMKKAASVRRRESVAAWLYGVARRVAARSRASEARRRDVEQQASRSPTITTPSPDREIWDEVDRLPETLRAAVVLCYLEGHTHEQAASRLGWPVGTVRSRLARARDRLRSRLARQGHGRDSLAGMVALLQRPEPISLPLSLVDRIARAALMLAARDAAEAGLVSSQAAALTQGVLHTMLIAKLKVAAMALVAAGALVTGAGVYAYQNPVPAVLPDRSVDRPRTENFQPTRVDPPPPVSRAEPPSPVPRVDPPSPADPLASRPAAHEMAEQIRKLTAEAIDQEAHGNREAARRTLDTLIGTAARWSQSLGDVQGPPMSLGSRLPTASAPNPAPYVVITDGDKTVTANRLVHGLEKARNGSIMVNTSETERRLSAVERKLDELLDALRRHPDRPQAETTLPAPAPAPGSSGTALTPLQPTPEVPRPPQPPLAPRVN